MLRSTALALIFVALTACNGAAPGATASPGASNSLAPASPTPAPTPVATPTAAATPGATTSAAPSGGAAAEVCGTDWSTSAGECDGAIGDRFLFQCPPGGRNNPIYGTDTYTDDSTVCVAAVHAGLIGFTAGGAVTIELTSGLGAYLGSSRNGVDSYDWGSWPTSFVFVGGAVAGPTPGVPTPADGDPTLLAHIPAVMRVNCHEVTTLSAGEVAAVSCTPADVHGYVEYVLFDTSAHLQDKFFGDLDYFGQGAENGRDCTVGPCLVAYERGGIVEGRYFANNYTGVDPNGLIAYWFDDSVLIEAGLAVYDMTFAELYSLALQAGPNP
jgi:hypothetical protein